MKSKDQLKFITCGSVDDGKSTLIGHMLYDAKLLFTDHESALELDSRLGSRDRNLDYSLLLDGLMAEREQGITIDVAYRFFTTEKRAFIVADCPGHDQYTRNMAVGASFADLAVILVDAVSGITTQTRRHARICSLMGIRHFVLAVNKMDLVGYEQRTFMDIVRDFKSYMVDLTSSIQAIPLSATEGDNLVTRSTRTPWYDGPTLLAYFEDIDIGEAQARSNAFLLPIQRVCRPNHTFRGFEGQIECGRIKVGDTVTALPGGEDAKVVELLVASKNAKEAEEGQPVTVRLDREVDVSRGSVLTRQAALEYTDGFTASLLWVEDSPLIAGRSYLLKCGTNVLPVEVTSIKHRLEIETGKRLSAKRLFKNEIGECDLRASDKFVFAKFSENKALGAFILIERVSNATAACGIIEHSLRRSTNISWQKNDITREDRAAQKSQMPKTFWFTGLSGSGKSALANALEKHLVQQGLHTMLLDGDNLRHGINKDLGFTEADRVENIRRVAEVAKLMNDAGLIVLTALIAPYARDRENARGIIGDAFVEIYVSTPLSVCEARDVKGLYKKARSGVIPEFTGISSPYEAPKNPDIRIDTSEGTLEEAVKYVAAQLKAYF